MDSMGTIVYGGSNGLGRVGTKEVVGMDVSSGNGCFKQASGPMKMVHFIYKGPLRSS